MKRKAGAEPVPVRMPTPEPTLGEIGETVGQCECGGDVIVMRTTPTEDEAATVCVACCKLDPTCKAVT